MSSIFLTQIMPASLNPHPSFPSALLPPVAFPLQVEIVLPPAIAATGVPTAPNGPIGLVGLGDACFWNTHGANLLKVLHQGGSDRLGFVSVGAQDRFDLGITQASFLALNGASHLTAGGPGWKVLRNASLLALRLMVENVNDWDNRVQGVVDQRPQAGVYERGSPSLALVDQSMNQVLATLNSQVYQTIITPTTSATQQAALQAIIDNEGDTIISLALEIVSAHPGTTVLLLAANSDVRDRLILRQSTGAFGPSPTIIIPGLPQSRRWPALKHLIGQNNVTLLPDSQRQMRIGPAPQTGSAFDLRVCLSDTRWLGRDFPDGGIITLDSNVLMETKIKGSPHPAIRFHEAALKLGLQLCIPMQVIRELGGGTTGHQDVDIQTFAKSAHLGQLQGTIDMSGFHAPPVVLPGASLPAIDPISLDKDNRIKWELMAMLAVMDLVPGDLTMITADKGMVVGMKSIGVGAILMAQNNNMVPGAVCYPAEPTDLVDGSINIIRKLAQLCILTV